MKLLIVMFVVLFFTACTPFIKPKVCEDSPSAILEITGGNPSGLDCSLLMVNIVALEKSAYTADEAFKVINTAKLLVTSGMGYENLFFYINKRVKELNRVAGFAILIMGIDVQRIAELGGINLISECDKVLILAHLDRQAAILSLYR